jgi:hypothetical protein
MRKALYAFFALALVFATTYAQAQQPEPASKPHLPRLVWSFDPVHGTLQATPNPGVNAATAKSPAPQSAMPTSSTYTGIAKVTVTVDLISSVPKEAALRCSGSISLQYTIQDITTTTTGIPGFEDVVLSSGENTDAEVSGGKAICRFSIPYSWTVPDATSSNQLVSVQIEAGAGIAADLLDSNQEVSRVLRSTSLSIPGPATFPADGSTITLTGNTVL